jgi:MarR family transcriptional regulator, lower aerobic nicotinate degradation pathway regulator
MSKGAADMTHHGDSAATPSRLRRIPSRLLATAAAYADRLVSAGLAEADAHKWHYAVLAALHDSGPASQAALSGRTGIYRSDMVAVLNELERRGFVQRVPDPEDRRRNIISISRTGTERLRHLDKLIGSLQDELLAPLSAADRERLVDLLSRLVAHHGDAAVRRGGK